MPEKLKISEKSPEEIIPETNNNEEVNSPKPLNVEENAKGIESQVPLSLEETRGDDLDSTKEQPLIDTEVKPDKKSPKKKVPPPPPPPPKVGSMLDSWPPPPKKVPPLPKEENKKTEGEKVEEIIPETNNVNKNEDIQTPESFSAEEIENQKAKDEQELADLHKDLEKTYGEGKEKLVEDPNRLTQEESDLLKYNFWALAESVKRLCIEFQYRDRDNLDPLIEPEYTDRLSLAALNLESMSDGTRIDKRSLEDAINDLRRMMGEIGNAGRRGGVNDNEENLARISFSLDNVELECQNVYSALGGINESDMKKLSALINKLHESMQPGRFYVAKKREAVRYYNNL